MSCNGCVVTKELVVSSLIEDISSVLDVSPTMGTIEPLRGSHKCDSIAWHKN